MGLSRDRILFGVHSITPYNQNTRIPYGIMKVMGGGNLELSADSEEIYGGSNRFPFASEATKISSKLTANTKSYPNFLMELFLGGTTTLHDASSSGEVRDYINSNGTSLKAATTGVATVTVKSGQKADLKFGRYVLVVASATTVDVYAMNDIDFNRGTKGSYLDDSLKIASGLSVVASTATAIPAFGIEMTGGSGTIGMTTGDTAIFDVYPEHKGISSILIGSATSQFPAFGAFMLAAKRNTREIFQIEAFNCAGAGMPIPLQEKAYAISDLTIQLLRDDSRDAVFSVTHLEEVS